MNRPTSKILFSLILLCVLVCKIDLSASGAPKLRFQNINKSDGLSNNNINAILRDSLGFLWVGTNDGLCRYEAPGAVKIFRPSDDKTEGLRSGDIRSLCLDKNENLWVGTRLGGLTRYHRPTDTWRTFTNNPADNKSLSNNDVLSILEDSKGRIWVGTENGLNLYQPETDSFISFHVNADKPNSLQAKAVLSIMEDHRGWLWMGTWAGGLHLMLPAEDGNIANNTFRRFLPNENMGTHNIWKIYQDSRNRYWIGTHGGGLLNMTIPTGASDVAHRQNWSPGFHGFTHELEKEGTLSNDYIQDILEDKKGQLWVGTADGINLIERKNFQDPLSPEEDYEGTPTIYSNSYTFNQDEEHSLAHNNASVIYEDEQGLIWIGTFSGLSIYNWYTSQFDVHHIEEELTEAQNIYIDQEGIAWLASGKDGLIKYNFKESKVIPFEKPIKDLAGKRVDALSFEGDNLLYLSMEDGVMRLDLKTYESKLFPLPEKFGKQNTSTLTPGLFKDDYGRIWMGTRWGLLVIDEATGVYTQYAHDPNDPSSISDNAVNEIYPDSKGNLWVTTYNGLNRISLKEKGDFVFERFIHDAQNPETTIASNRTIALEEVDDILYIGTTKGLCGYDYNTKEFTSFSKNEHKFWVQSMEKTHDGRIWGSSTEGVFLFNTKTKSFNVFEKQDGLGDLTFRLSSSYTDEYGYICFGSRNGLTRFHPDKIIRNTIMPPVYITDIKKMNARGGASMISGVTLKEHVMYHDDYFVSFDFAALNYNRPEKNRYAYKLEGFEDEWNYTNKVTPAVYTNLEHGTYTFRVKAANNDGLWNEAGAAIKLIKKPAFWETIWFPVTCLLLFCVACIFGAGFYTKGIRERNQMLSEYNEGLSSEIQQRKRIEKALQESEYFVRLVLDNIPQYIYWIDKDHRLLGGNDAFFKVHKLNGEANVLGRAMDALHGNRMHFVEQKAMEQKVMTSGVAIYNHQYELESDVVQGINQHCWMEQNLIPLLDENKEVIGVLVSLEDISTRMEAASILKGNSMELEIQVTQRTKELNEKNREVQQLLNKLEVRNEELEKIVQKRTESLSESNKDLLRTNKDLEQFAYIASHDLKEPLRIIGNFVGLLSRKYKNNLDDTANEFIHYIEDGVKRMTALIDSVLTYSGVGKKEIVLKNGKLNNMLELKMRDLSQRIKEKNVDIQINELPTIFCEIDQIGMVFYNLINNAIKFNKNEKPRVVVTAHDDAPEGFWKFSVADNGIGIPPEFQDKIFEIFRRLHNKQDYEGTGIGLALCQKIIYRHGGRIWIESIPGEGATFFFTIDKNLTENGEVGTGVQRAEASYN